MTRHAARVWLVAGTMLSGRAAWAQDPSPTPVDEDEIRAIVHEVMADAQTRTSLQATGATGGHDAKGFFLASDDGAFRLNISGYVQTRYYLNFRDENGGDEQFESGFEIRRSKFTFDGTIHQGIFFQIQGNFSSATGDYGLQDAFAGYKWENGIQIRAGQFKLPFLREELVPDTQQLTADRSMVAAIFGQGRGVSSGRSQGVEMSYREETWRCMMAFSDGFGSANSLPGDDSPFSTATGFTNGGGEADWALTARGDFIIAGNWDLLRSYSGFPGDDYACMVGIAGHVEQSDNGIPADLDGDLAPDIRGQTTLGAWTLDLTVKGDGWNFFVAGNGHHGNNNLARLTPAGAAPLNSFDDFGLVTQGGFFLPNTDWELFARHEVTFLDSARTTMPGQNDAFNTITAGANWYIHGHAVKVTADVVWHLDDFQPLLGPLPAVGYFRDSNDDNEVTVRLQFQILF